MAKSLRVMNAVRDKSIGIPVTLNQYNALGPELLIQRLSRYLQHHTAFEICKYFDLSTDSVLTHWACAKVKHDKSPEPVVAQQILNKLVPSNIQTFSDIIRVAKQKKKPEIAKAVIVTYRTYK